MIDIDKYMDSALNLSEAYASAYEYMHDIKNLMNNAKGDSDEVYLVGLAGLKGIIQYLQTLKIVD